MIYELIITSFSIPRPVVYYARLWRMFFLSQINRVLSTFLKLVTTYKFFKNRYQSDNNCKLFSLLFFLYIKCSIHKELNSSANLFYFICNFSKETFQPILRHSVNWTQYRFFTSTIDCWLTCGDILSKVW